MPYQPSHRHAATGLEPPMVADNLDALLIDDEADEFLDHHLAAIRDSLADDRSF